MKRFVTRRAVLAGLAASAAASGLRPALAQTAPYPSRPIKIIVPWTAGGGGDALVRAMTPSLARRLGQPLIVENRPGAIGTIGSVAAARSPADGYTIVYGTADSHSIAPHVLKTPPYDARKDFVAIAPIGFTPLAVVVHASHPATTLAQLLQMAKDAKEPLSYGSWGQGSSGQIVVEALKQKTKINLLHIPYNGTAPLIQAQLANQVNCSIAPVLVADPYVQAGSLRILAITARERLPGFADVPLLKELGIEIDMGPWLGFLAPAGTPADIVDRLNAAITATIAEAQVTEVMRKMAMVIDRMGPSAYQQFVNGEFERWGAYIRTAKISLDP